jgi:hypothetical protein
MDAIRAVSAPELDWLSRLQFRDLPGTSRTYGRVCRPTLAMSPETVVLSEKLENWGTFTPDEYPAKAVHHAEHALHSEFLSVIRHPQLAVPSSQLRADYFGLL